MATSMIDRTARDQVVALLDSYLADQITAFEFDERLQEVETEDQSVRDAIHAAWFHYDDCTDHKVVLTKEQWDYFQRLSLLLKSDAVISFSETKCWSWDHAIAWLSLALFLVVSFVFVGWGIQLALFAIPFGVISMLIARYREKAVPESLPNEIACFPFASFSQIRWLRRQVPGFQKRKYRQEIKDRMIRPEGTGWFWRVYARFIWLIFSPVVLFFQGLPSSRNGTCTLATTEGFIPINRRWPNAG